VHLTRVALLACSRYGLGITPSSHPDPSPEPQSQAQVQALISAPLISLAENYTIAHLSSFPLPLPLPLPPAPLPPLPWLTAIHAPLPFRQPVLVPLFVPLFRLGRLEDLFVRIPRVRGMPSELEREILL
jgi:hypothetical protein